MARKSKKKKLEELEKARIEERKSIKEKLEKEELYSPSIEPLIENYLDAFVIYKSMYEEWKKEGFPPTKLHENKAGAINEMKHPLAQHVETWKSVIAANQSRINSTTSQQIPTWETKSSVGVWSE